MFNQILTCFIALWALAFAHDLKIRADPSGNPIGKPGLNDIVPAGQPYTITWTPTTQGTVSLYLLRGPSTNVVRIATIVEGIQNSGSYSWTPSASLQADTTGYGITITVDGTEIFQYSSQFGISNASGGSGASASSYVAPSVAPSHASSMVMSVTSSGSAHDSYPTDKTSMGDDKTSLVTGRPTRTTGTESKTSASLVAQQTTNAGNKLSSIISLPGLLALSCFFAGYLA